MEYSDDANRKFHVLAFNLLVFVKANTAAVAASPTNKSCLPILRVYELEHPLPATDGMIIAHPYYNRQWQDEWHANSATRREQFKLFSRLSEYVMPLLKEETQSETALVLYTPSTALPSSGILKRLHAPVPYVSKRQMIEAVPRPSLITRLWAIIVNVPVFQFPIGSDGGLRWIFRMPNEIVHPVIQGQFARQDLLMIAADNDK